MSKNNEVVFSLETNNKDVTFNLEKADNLFSIFQLVYGEREDLILYSEDEEFMKKVLSFLVYAYNDGLQDGKNIAIMFNM